MTTEKILFTIAQQSLRYLLERAHGSVGRMHPYFKIDVYFSGRVTCCATDLRVGVLAELDNRNGDTTVQSGGTFCLFADKFYALICALPSQDITLQGLDNDRIQVTCGTYSGVFPCVDHQQYFPDMIIPGGSPDIVCAGGFLNDIYAAISHAAGGSADSPLSGIHIKAENKRLVGVAANGQRLSIAGVSIPYDGECEPFNAGVTLAVKSLAEIKKLNCGSCDVRIRDNRMSIDQSNITIVSMLYEQSYPNYRLIVPNHPNCAVVSVSQLQEITQRVSIINAAAHIQLSIAQGQVSVSGESTAGLLSDCIPCETEASPVSFLVTPAHLQDSLKSLAKDGDDIIIKWLDEKSSIVLLPADHSNWDERLELIQPRSN